MLKYRSFKCSECQRTVSNFYIMGFGYDNMQFDKILCYDCWKYHRDSGENMFRYRYYSASDIFKLEEEKEKIKEQEELKNKIIQMGIDCWVEDIERRYLESHGHCPVSVIDEINYAPWEYIRKLESKCVKYHYYREGEGHDGYGDWTTIVFDDVTYHLNDVIHKIRYGY